VQQPSQSGGFFGFKLGVEKMPDGQLPEVLSPLESDNENVSTPPVEMSTPPVEMSTPPIEMSTPPVEMSTPPVEQPQVDVINQLTDMARQVVNQAMTGGKNYSWMEDSDLELSSITDLSSSDSLSDFDL
jgi:hypothetical protein